MEITSVRDIPSTLGRETDFKNPVVTCLIFTFVTFIVALSCFLLAPGGGYPGQEWNLPPGLFYGVGSIFAIMALIGRFYCQARWRPSNWLVRLRPDQMLIKFRSYLNDHFPEDDPVVAAIQYSEIEWVRKTREKRISASMCDPGTKATSWHTYLDIKLNRQDGLKEILARERNRPAPQSRVAEITHELFLARKRKAPKPEITRIKETLKTERSLHKKKMRGSGTRHHHYPVRMADSELLRVEWAGIKPGIKGILTILRGKVSVEPELTIKTDDTLTVEGKDLDSQILELAERGKKLDAISMVRQKYGYSLAQSKEIVEGLM